MGEISFLKRVAWRWCGVHFFPGTKGPFGGFLLPETDPLGPAGARVLITVWTPEKLKRETEKADDVISNKSPPYSVSERTATNYFKYLNKESR